MIPNVNVWPTNGCYVQHHTGSPLLSLRHLCVLRISGGNALAIGLLCASRVSLAVGLEPPGELPCWPCSHLPVTKRGGRTVRCEHGPPISRRCDSKTRKSCWFSVNRTK